MINDPTIQSSNCTNCGAEFIGDYCYKCGQKKIELKDKSVKAFVVHFAEEFFTFDSKFFRTVKFLLFKPGYLTHEYISGRFVRYVTPLKLYLFTSIIVFFIILKFEPDTYKEIMEPADSDEFLQEIITDQRETLGMEEAEFGEKFNSIINGLFTPGIFIMMLVFSVCLKLMYINKHIFYVEHLVFTLHFFSMVLIFFTLQTIIREINEGADIIFLFLVPFVYLILSVKRVYHTKWIYSLISSVIMFFIYVFLLYVWVLGTVFYTLINI